MTSRHQALIGICAIIPLVVSMWGYNPSVPTSQVYPATALLARAKELVGTDHRLAAYSPESRTPLAPNGAMVMGLYDVRGYEVVRLRGYDELMSIDSERDQAPRRSIRGYSPLLDLAAVNTILLPVTEPEMINTFLQHGWTLDRTKDGVSLLYNPHARSRAMLTQNVVSRGDQTIDAIRTSLEQGVTATILNAQGATGSSSVPDQAVPIQSQSANSLSLSIPQQPGGYLVLADAYDSGWQAAVDGQTAPVLIADGAFRAIKLSPGTHRVTFSYRPLSWIVGLWVSGVTVLGLLGLLAFAKRRKRQSL